MKIKFMMLAAMLSVFTVANAVAADEVRTENTTMKTEASKMKKQTHADEKSGAAMSDHAAKDMDKPDAMKQGMDKSDAMNMKQMGNHDHHMMGGKH